MLAFLRRRRRLEVDVGVLETAEREALSGFLRSNLRTEVKLNGGRIAVDSEQLSVDELKRLVTKFVYHRNLNRLYWAAIDGSTVHVHKFDKAKKHEKRSKESTPPRIVTHGW